MTLQLRVQEVRDLNPLILQLRLEASDGAAMPGFSAGARRVQVKLQNGETDWRQYSLVELDPAADLEVPNSYTIAVRREDDGHGGSRFMHGVLQGDFMQVDVPKNDFSRRGSAGCVVLVAGGIGVTPLATMAAQCLARGQGVRMHYAGRASEWMAFLPELRELLKEDLWVHEDSVACAPLDVDSLLAACGREDQIRVCGPKALLDAVLTKANARGWPSEQLHFEVFTSPAAEEDVQAFDVVLAQTGRTLQVGARQSVLDCLVEAGCDPLFDCKRGECGVCSAAVLEGEIDHRHYFLSDVEKVGGRVMQLCVSRARGGRFVLDLYGANYEQPELSRPPRTYRRWCSRTECTAATRRYYYCCLVTAMKSR